MGIFDFLRDKEEDDFDPLQDLKLSKLKVGYYVDYDLKTWEVTAYNRYDYGDGYYGEEWELTCGRETLYLEREEDDEVLWTISKKLPIGAIEGDVTRYITDHDDPPNQIVVKGKTYFLEESGSAYFLEGGKGEGVGIIQWDFIDKSDEHFITIEQWGESEFEASEGTYVEEYQFSDILPGNEGQA